MEIIKRIIKKAFRVCTGCEILYKTNWYKSMFLDPEHEIYPDNVWYRNHEERNFDIINLGSSSAKWAFDYGDFNVKAMNWAQQPQTLLEDYNLLRHFHSILRDGGYVLITIMPFTGLNKETGIYDALKYARFDLQGEPIQPHLFEEAQRYAKYPILFKKPAVKALVKYLLGKDQTNGVNLNTQLEHNPMNVQQLEEDAQRWIAGWKRQFAIDDFDAPLTPLNQEGRGYRIKLMRELIDFCTERGYKPLYVIPPATEYLAHYFTPQFEQTYIYSFLKDINRDVQILDYSKDLDLKNEELYFNSFFLNKHGRKIFTKKVLKDIGLVK